MHDTLPEPRVLIGARGWRHAGWAGTFYPDDLPDDWRLGYYGNEFAVVGVPAAAWAETGGPVQWLADSGDHLRFVCELPVPGLDPAAVDAGLEALGSRCLGVMVVEPLPESVLLELAGRRPLVLATGEPLSPALQRAGASGCWDGTGTPPAGGRLNLIRLQAAAPSPRALRPVLEGALAWPGTEHTVLLFAAPDPSVQAMHDAATLLELL